MKLDQQQTEQIQEKTGLEPVPSEVAETSGLTEHFGDNTFYLSTEGVFVFEEGTWGGEAKEAGTVTAVRIAAVEQTGGEAVVRGIEPEKTTVTVELAQDAP